MPFDFPNSPSVGQRVTGVGGIVYVWDGVKWASNIGAVTAQSMGDVGRNLLHNPLFNVAQRGAGPWGLGGYTADRWQIAGVSDGMSATLISGSDALRAAIGDDAVASVFTAAVTGNAAAGAYSTFQQPIEDVLRLAGKTITLSFWAAADVPYKLGINYLQTWTSGSQTWANATGQSVTIGPTWTRYSVTTTLPGATGKTIGTPNYTALAFAFSSGATNNALFGNIGVQTGGVFFWGVQLEIGSVATPLEKPDPRYDLSNCQRFYQTGWAWAYYSNCAAGSTVGNTYSLKVSMRSQPTMSPTSGSSNANIGTLTFNALGVGEVGVFGAVIAAGGVGISAGYIASADL